jgi:hypothetical protein
VPVLVAVDITNERDDIFEGEEQFRLSVKSDDLIASGYSSIFDDGTGSITQAITSLTTNYSGANDPSISKDDDRQPILPAPPPPPAQTQLAPPAAAPSLPEPPPPPKATQSFSSAIQPLVPRQALSESFAIPLGDAVTSGSGYQIPVLDSAPMGLSLFRGVTDQVVQSTGIATKISLPFDAFVHSNKDATIALEAKLADDSSLPSWVQFDPATGVFEVTPPPGFKGKLDLKVVARDDDGREAVALFQMFVGEEAPEAPRPQSRDSLADKLRMATKKPMPAAKAPVAVPA